MNDIPQRMAELDPQRPVAVLCHHGGRSQRVAMFLVLAAIAAERFGALALLAPTDPVLALTCGRLVERERANVHVARAAFGQVWRDVKGERTTRWMRP